MLNEKSVWLCDGKQSKTVGQRQHTIITKEETTRKRETSETLDSKIAGRPNYDCWVPTVQVLSGVPCRLYGHQRAVKMKPE